LHVAGIKFNSITRAEKAIAKYVNVNKLRTALVEVLTQLLAEGSPYPTVEPINQSGMPHVNSR
jgi:hypothetical protein